MERTNRIYDAVSRAQHLGTLNAVDRSAQYQDPDSREQLRYLNEAWSKIRCLEKAITLRDAKLLELDLKVKKYKVANIALTAIITGLAWEGCKALILYLSSLPIGLK